MAEISGLVDDIDEALKHQKKWRQEMSKWYSVLAVVAIVASSAATVLAGFGNSEVAAVMAATATAALAIEKTLQLREKWLHHVRTSAQLNSIKINLKHGDLAKSEAARKLGLALQEYAEGLPVEQRDSGQPAQASRPTEATEPSQPGETSEPTQPSETTEPSVASEPSQPDTTPRP